MTEAAYKRVCGNIRCYQKGCRRCDPDYVEPPLEETDPLYAALVAAEPYLNENWVHVPGGPLKPFEVLSLRYCIVSTNYHIGMANARAAAKEELQAALEKARQRYRSGFYANPFGEPVRRPA